MMTPGEIRWIKKHTEKTLKELNMKSTKKRPSKRTVAHTKNPIVGKLLRLKYKINEAYRSYPHETNKTDKSWVMNLISDVRKNDLTKLCKEDMLKCNSIWRKYD